MLASWQVACLFYNSTDLDTVDVDTLPIAVCGVLGRLLHEVPDVAPLRARLAGRLRQELQPVWMETCDIATLALALDGLQACASHEVTGSDIVTFASRLLATEVTVGGPYRQDAHAAQTDVEPITNACIAQCLRWMAEPLPNVSSFLAATIPDVDTIEPTELALYAALQSPHHTITRQFLAHMPLLRTALSLQIMHQSEAYVGDHHPVDGSLIRSIHLHCLRSMPRFTEPFETNTRSMLEQVIRVDTNNEISQLAWYYGNALADTTVAYKVTSNTLLQVHLGAANIYAWAAYKIYGDFLDNEGQPPMLGTALCASRAMLRQYQAALPNDMAFQKFVEQTLVTVDQAVTFETTFFRMPATNRTITVGSLPDFGVRDLLANRALFHSIGPMAILATTGRAAVGDVVWEHTFQALRHYLIARQLNDDIHDWVEDLQAGQATYVVVELLRYLNITPGTYAFDQLLPYAREQFWQHVLPHICDTALEHIRTAHEHLQHGLQLTDRNPFVGLFDYIESSMYATQAKRAQSQILLQSFRGN